MIRTLAATLATGIFIAAPAAPAAAQPRAFAIPAGTLKSALDAYARQSGRQVVYRGDEVRSARSRGVRGTMSADAALDAVLADSGFVAQADRSGAIGIRRAVGNGAAPADDAPPEAALDDRAGPADDDIVITGSRIRGAPVASTMIRIDADRARNAGQASIPDIIRTIPQNFGGGQNPGIGMNVPESIGSDVGGGSSFNLRGLGSDATLTLLNGHRLPYSASAQSIDVSAIPLDAVDRIEVVADGASAIYGSDAVAGVANIILKRDYDGLRTSARAGGATDGGYDVRQLSAVGGQAWGSGGLILAYQFDRSTRIYSRQRDYAAETAPGVTMFPYLRRHSFVASAHQALAPGITVSIDALYGLRRKESEGPSNAAGDLSVSHFENNSKSRSFVIAPSVKADLGGGWRAELLAMYGKDRVIFGQTEFVGTTATSNGENCYCNTGRAIELGADGRLFDLPGGSAQIAFGAGWRDNALERRAPLNPLSNFEAGQDSRFAYAEIGLPFVSPGQGIRGIDRLSLSAAIRHERYPGIDNVSTPKIGLIYAPVEGFTLKGSWGQSFRAPTLIQLHFFNQSVVAPPIVFGGTGFPAGSAAIYSVGGNPDLKPERARSWSATVVIEPASIPDLRLEFGAFYTRYRDRIVTPIQQLGASLRNPAFADLIVRNPTAAEVEAVLGRADVVGNLTGGPIDPARIVALINNYDVNAARQTIKGVDMLASYRWRLAGGTLDLSANASLLDSTQVRGPEQPSFDLAGIIFNPPHFRARSSASWARGPLNLALSINHADGVSDTRFSPALPVHGMTTFDAALRIRPESGPARGFDLTLSAENLFNRKPAQIAKQFYYDTPYDSTNYSPVGRFVSVTLAKAW